MSDYYSGWLQKEADLGMTPSTFIRYNGEGAWMDVETRTFLTTVGLPKDAQPGLSFRYAETIPDLIRVYDNAKKVFKTKNDLLIYSQKLVGTDSNDDFVCIDSHTGRVFLFFQKDHLKTCQFVNSRISLLAHFLYCYFLRPEAEYLHGELSKVDPPAMAKGCFWWGAVNQLRPRK